MGIFDRLGRLARAEISEMKRVLSERDPPGSARPRAAESEEAAYQRAIDEAEAELAREHGEERDDIDGGAAVWGNPDGVTGQRADLDRGAAIWGDAAADEEPAPRTRADRAATKPYESRVHAFPREVREAYAALELPLGADRDQIDRSFRELVHRYHPDKHMNDPKRHALANDLTIRIREARTILMTWISRAP